MDAHPKVVELTEALAEAALETNRAGGVSPVVSRKQSCASKRYQQKTGGPEKLLRNRLKKGNRLVAFLCLSRYLDFPADYGFEPRACNIRKANEKAALISDVGYLKAKCSISLANETT